MADIQVTNTDADLSDNTLLTEENAYTITGLHTFSRSTNAPFAVNSGAAVVANLDADKLDGIEATGFVKANGTVALTADWDAGGYEIRAQTLEADVSTGTAPLTIASTTKVDNLNADKLDDQEGSYYLDPGNLSSAVAVNKGGTGATSLTDGGVLLGSGTGAVTAMAVLADGEMIVGDGTTDPVAESGATLRTSIGVGTGDSPQFTAVELGHASDTTIARASAGNVTIEGNEIYRAGGTDVPVADGGTGASSLTDGGVLLGSGTSAITAMAVLSDGEMIVGDGTTDPVAESGSTLRASIGCDAAGNITSGTMATARLGSGTASSSTYLRGDSSWAAIAAGGGFPFLDKATLTSGELQTGTISLAASGCLVIFQNVEVDTDGVSMHLIINAATSGYDNVQRLSRQDGSHGYGAAPTDALYLDTNIATHGRLGNGTGEQAHGHVYLSSDGTYLNWHGLVYEQNPNGDPTVTQIAGVKNLGGAITSITMASSSGNIDGGEMMVYDIKES